MSRVQQGWHLALLDGHARLRTEPPLMPTERPPPAAVVLSSVYCLYKFWSPALRGSDPSLARIPLARRGLLHACDTSSYLGRASFWSDTLTEEVLLLRGGGALGPAVTPPSSESSSKINTKHGPS